MKLRALKEYALIFILLFFSGNPLASFWFGKSSAFVALILTVFVLKDRIKAQKNLYPVYLKVMIILLTIFAFQWFELGFVSWLGILNFLIKIFTGALIIHYFQDRFSENLFKVLYHLSFISLILFFLINIVGFPFPVIDVTDVIKSYGIYSTAFYPLKNQGMFWEPGAYAGILTLCLALNFNYLPYYWKNHRFKTIVVFLTLLSTQSTTGYLTAFVILLFYFISIKNKFVSIFILPLIFSTGLYFYENTEFLKDKIEGQYKNATEQGIGELSNTRFGSLIFDWYYINKHPLIGNGIHEKTRYADHQYLFVGAKGEDQIGSGNGFSNYLASMGVLFIIGYFIMVYRAYAQKGKLYAILILLVVLLNLQGEQWFNFPIYLGLAFANFRFESLNNLRARFTRKVIHDSEDLLVKT